ncbi:MAG: hypothetical protein KME40_15035 [Komarekiella atlantica HA4396-MV6]|nr:hypothetical protein [Komarekiella atlantica HA4396-MV6]
MLQATNNNLPFGFTSRSWGASVLGSQHVAEVPSVVVTGVGSANLYPCGEASYKAASPLGRSNWRGNPQTLDDSLPLRYRPTALWASYGGRLPFSTRRYSALGEDRAGSPLPFIPRGALSSPFFIPNYQLVTTI